MHLPDEQQVGRHADIRSVCPQTHFFHKTANTIVFKNEFFVTRFFENETPNTGGYFKNKFSSHEQAVHTCTTKQAVHTCTTKQVGKQEQFSPGGRDILPSSRKNCSDCFR